MTRFLIIKNITCLIRIRSVTNELMRLDLLSSIGVQQKSKRLFYESKNLRNISAFLKSYKLNVVKTYKTGKLAFRSGRP